MQLKQQNKDLLEQTIKEVRDSDNTRPSGLLGNLKRGLQVFVRNVRFKLIR